ncbi:MAG: VWA domain-containing protein [Anaerolineae bacterium]|nr:VWA domain-containing protein [Anaerolineae bacterium]
MRRQKITHTILLLAMFFSLTGFRPANQSEDLNIRITQIDTSDFPQVTVFVSITDANSEPVAIAPDRIRLAEDGEEIPADQITGAGEVGSLTTLLVVDISGSMLRVGKLEAAQSAAKVFINQLRPGDRVGLMTFNEGFDYVQPVTSDRALIMNAIDGLEAVGDTAMYDALSEAITSLEATEGRKAIVALTDGLDNLSEATPDSVLDQIDREGLSISTIGLGDPSEAVDVTGLDEEALKYLAENAGGVYGYADDIEGLSELYRSYAVAFKSEYQLTYTSPSELRDGVNRALSVYLVDASVSASTSTDGAVTYNPGGLVPEVSEPAPWISFGWLMAGLVALLFVPSLLKRAMGTAGKGSSGGKKKSRIKLKD